MDVFHVGPRQHQVLFPSCSAANCQQKGEILFENRRVLLPRPSAVCSQMVLNNTFPSVYTPLGKNGKGTSPTRYRSTSDCCTHEKKSAYTRHDRTACSFFFVHVHATSASIHTHSMPMSTPPCIHATRANTSTTTSSWRCLHPL